MGSNKSPGNETNLSDMEIILGAKIEEILQLINKNNRRTHSISVANERIKVAKFAPNADRAVANLTNEIMNLNSATLKETLMCILSSQLVVISALHRMMFPEAEPIITVTAKKVETKADAR